MVCGIAPRYMGIDVSTSIEGLSLHLGSLLSGRVSAPLPRNSATKTCNINRHSQVRTRLQLDHPPSTDQVSKPTMESTEENIEHLQRMLEIQYVLPRRVTGSRYLSDLSISLG